jgi:3-carboxy-cis,cis-muconate cycloisomerase
MSDRAFLQAMLDFEAALARVGAPPDAARAIAEACRAERFDAAAIEDRAALTGTPVVPLLEDLRAALPEGAAAYVHRGATSQDAIDTAAMLVAHRALGGILEDLRAAADAAARLAAEHRDTPMAGRTLLQQAVPITFGLKAAGWMTGLDDAAARLDTVRGERLAVQLGGPAGTLAEGIGLLAALARELGLAEPVLPWHTARGRIAELAGALGEGAGAAAKPARDVVLLAQTEVAEAREGGDEPGRGGSSSMPHKRNPVAAVATLASARSAPALVATLLASMESEHERAAGAWQAEWPALRELLGATASAARGVRGCLERLEPDPDRMRANMGVGGDTGNAAALVDRALRAHTAR